LRVILLISSGDGNYNPFGTITMDAMYS